MIRHRSEGLNRQHKTMAVCDSPLSHVSDRIIRSDRIESTTIRMIIALVTACIAQLCCEWLHDIHRSAGTYGAPVGMWTAVFDMLMLCP